MRRGTVFLFLFVLIVAAIIGVSQFLRSQPPLEIRVAVDPLVEAWIRDEIQRFNASAPLVNNTVRVLATVEAAVNDVRVWREPSFWRAGTHPHIWIPSSSYSVEYAPLPFVPVADSLAHTPLVWGGYASRVDVLTQNGTRPLDWALIAEAAAVESWEELGGQASWRFLKLAFNLPSSSMAGAGVLYSGAAAYHDTSALSRAMLTNAGFLSWMRPIIASMPGPQTLGSNPAASMAARGTSVAELALLPESQWLVSLEDLLRNEPVVFAYPEYAFVLDFPLALWDDLNTTAEERAAAAALADWLLSAPAQARAALYGLRPAGGELAPDAALFIRGEAYGIQLAPADTPPLALPGRNETEGLIQSFN